MNHEYGPTPPRIRSALAAIAAVALLAVPVAAHAQAPDTAAAAEEPNRWAFSADLAFTNISGNRELLVLTSGAEITHLRTQSFELTVGAQFRYGRSRGEEVANDLRLQTDLVLSPDARVSPFFFSSAQREPLRRLEVRLNGGGGVTYTFVESPTAEAVLSVAALYNYDNYLVPAQPVEPTFDEVDQSARWRLHFEGRTEITPKVRIENRIEYEPEWNAFGDYFMSTETSLAVQVTEAIALTATHTFERDSDPVGKVEENDRFLQFGLSFTTRW